MSKEKDKSGGFGLFGILTIVFIVFKLTDNIDWSWWWVFSPVWIVALIVLSILIFVAILEYLFGDLFKW